ncbi:MAG: hypothetical protein ACOCG6_02365 [Candidatus Cloacimonadaceae bacterium]
MTQINAILKKEWDIHKLTFMFPLFFLVGFTIVLVALFTFLIIKMGMPSMTWGFDSDLNHVVVWVIQYSVAGAIALICAIIMFSLQNTLMNKDHENRFEVFHSCQPISMLKSLSTKMLFVIGGQMLLFTALTLIANLSISLIMGSIFKTNFLYAGLNAYITAIPYLLSGIISLVPLSILFSAIFKKRGNFFYLLINLYAIDSIVRIANHLWQLEIGSLHDFFFGFLIDSFPNMSKFDMPNMPKLAFGYLFSMHHLWQLILGFVFIIAAYFIYKRREIS